MLRRSLVIQTSQTRSLTTGLNRLDLDINSQFERDQLVKDPTPAIEKSAAAIRGEGYRSDVILPTRLIDAVEKAIEDGEDKPGLRLKALDLYTHLRTSAAIPTGPTTSYRDRQALLTTYDPPTSLAYLAGLMPSFYGATVAVLSATKDRLNLLNQSWEPDRLVDYGSGTGSGAWALHSVWGNAVTTTGRAREYIGLDSSRAMIELSSTMLGALPFSEPTLPPTPFDPVKLTAATHQIPLPASTSALGKLKLSPASSLPITGLRTIAMAAFSLGDLGTKEKRKDIIKAMWASGAEVIVIIDRGTPAGSRIVVEAREQLLMLGKRSMMRDTIEGSVEAERGCYVLTPCPHDGDCPLHHSTRSYCHFSQRVRSPPFLRHTKHTTRGEDDAKYSYVVIQRGTRPGSPSILMDEADEEAELGIELEEVEAGQIPVEDIIRELTEEEIEIGRELGWPRLVNPPLKRSGHIILEVCAESGLIERHTIPKSQGKQEYYDARKVKWGDSFPHAPKNGAQLAPRGNEEEALDKFGKGRSKLRSKKQERTGRGKYDEDDEIDSRSRRSSRSTSEHNDGGGGGIKEYELEIDGNGDLKILN